MLEKIKTFFKAQRQKIPPLWKIYVNMASRYDVPVRSLRMLLVLDRYERYTNIFRRYPDNLSYRSIALGLLGLILLSSLGTGLLWAIGYVATAELLSTIVFGVFFIPYAAYVVNLLVLDALVLALGGEYLFNKITGGISTLLIKAGASLDHSAALVAKAELDSARNLIKLNINDDWAKIKALYLRAEKQGHPDARKLLIEKAAGLLMRNTFPQKPVSYRRTRWQRSLDAGRELLRRGLAILRGRQYEPPPAQPLTYAIPYTPVDLGDLEKAAFEKMVHCRYTEEFDHRDQALRSPVRFFKESSIGMTPLMLAIGLANEIQISLSGDYPGLIQFLQARVPDPELFFDKKKNVQLDRFIQLNIKFESSDKMQEFFEFFKEFQRSIAVITDLFEKAENLNLPIELKVKMITSKFNDGWSVSDALTTNPVFQYNPIIQSHVSLITDEIRRKPLKAAEEVKENEESKENRGNIENVAEYIVNLSREMPIKMIKIIDQWRDKDINPWSGKLCLMSELLKEKDGTPALGKIYFEKQEKRLRYTMKYKVINLEGKPEEITVTDLLDINSEEEKSLKSSMIGFFNKIFNKKRSAEEENSANTRFLRFLNEKRVEILSLISEKGYVPSTLCDVMRKKEEDLVQETMEKIHQANARHQKELGNNAQSIHKGGADKFTEDVRKVLKDDFKNNDIEKSNKEFRGYIETLLNDPKPEGYTGPDKNQIRTAIKIYDFIIGLPAVGGKKGSSELMALIWRAVNNTEKLTGSYAAGVKPEELSENLKQRMVLALYESANTYESSLTEEARRSCAGGIENRLALVLNQSYAGLIFNFGFEKVGNIDRINEQRMAEELIQKIIVEARKKANKPKVLAGIFLRYPQGVALTQLEEDTKLKLEAHPDKDFWKDVIDAAFAKLWLNYPLSHSEFLNMRRSTYKFLKINPLVLLKPDFDLEAQYLAFCKGKQGYKSLKDALDHSENQLKEFYNYIKLPEGSEWMRAEKIISHGLKLIDKETLTELLFDYEEYYINFCQSITDVDMLRKAVANPRSFVSEFSKYLRELKLDVPEWQLWQLKESAVAEGLSNVSENKVKALLWKKLGGEKRWEELIGDETKHSEYLAFLRGKYLEFCISLDQDTTKFEKAVNEPAKCRMEFEQYLSKLTESIGSDNQWKWILDGFVVKHVLDRMGLKPNIDKLKRELKDLLPDEKENAEAREILLTVKPNMVFQGPGAAGNGGLEPDDKRVPLNRPSPRGN